MRKNSFCCVRGEERRGGDWGKLTFPFIHPLWTHPFSLRERVHVCYCNSDSPIHYGHNLTLLESVYTFAVAKADSWPPNKSWTQHNSILRLRQPPINSQMVWQSVLVPFLSLYRDGVRLHGVRSSSNNVMTVKMSDPMDTFYSEEKKIYPLTNKATWRDTLHVFFQAVRLICLLSHGASVMVETKCIYENLIKPLLLTLWDGFRNIGAVEPA